MYFVAHAITKLPLLPGLAVVVRVVDEGEDRLPERARRSVASVAHARILSDASHTQPSLPLKQH